MLHRFRPCRRGSCIVSRKLQEKKGFRKESVEAEGSSSGGVGKGEFVVWADGNYGGK